MTNKVESNFAIDEQAEIASISEWNMDCPRLLEVSVHVDEKVLTCMIDSGATHSFIHASVV